MSVTHNKLLHGNNFTHWKFSDLVVDLNYFSFSRPNPYPTGLPKHEFPTPNFFFKLVCVCLQCSVDTWEKSRMLTLKTNRATYCKNHSYNQHFCHFNTRCLRLGSQDVHQTQIWVMLEKGLEPLVRAGVKPNFWPRRNFWPVIVV